jgi:hypothetical protein
VAIERGRRAAEALMVDACTVGRPVDVYTDQTNGQVVTVSTPVYEGRCKVQQTIAQSSSPEAGSHQYTVQTARLDLPVSAGPVMVDDTVTVTAAVMDPQLVGRVYRVVELFHKSFATAQRVRVEEVTS